MKKCPNCGAEVEADSKFCTNCGAQLQENVAPESASAQPQPGAQRAVPAQPNGFTLYWKWLVDSWKRPTAKLDTEKWYGITNILVVILLITLTCWRLLSGIVTKSINSMSGSMGDISETAEHYANNALGGSIANISISIFFAILIGVACFIGFGILGRKFIYGEQIDVLAYINSIAQYSNYNVAISLLMFLLALISVDSVKFIGFLFVILYYVFLTAVLVPVIGNGKEKNDKVWGTLITFLGLVIGSLIAYFIAKSAIMTVVNQLLSSLKLF
ncbi:zinc ribbon domain-containing protein [Lactobacillus sp. PV034]|uniref:zinc ribbon domain-containing protein n=1 Tax=Lactobacillus sp. PV034 TaxID=2594495 RepID=UPI00223EECB6|nr:zinc ribbon domain-containing protein [Lactobacillus sp. PV034]QNQ81068.1 zinc ribbon domain-containing protein [Lactobacillus sp. PV034]